MPCSYQAKANVKAKIFFDVCHLFFDHFYLFQLSNGVTIP